MPRDLFIQAIENIISGKNCKFIIRDEFIYSNLEWLCEEHEKPSEEDVMTKFKELQDAEPMRILRIERNKLLEYTDKYSILDYPMTDEERDAIRVYRQILRDLPQNNTTEIPYPPEILKQYVNVSK